MPPRGWAPALLALVALALVLGRAPGAVAAPSPPPTNASTLPPPRVYPVTYSDFVCAFPADEAHMDVARASRIWRKVRRGTRFRCGRRSGGGRGRQGVVRESRSSRAGRECAARCVRNRRVEMHAEPVVIHAVSPRVLEWTLTARVPV